MEAGQDTLTVYTIGHGNATDQKLIELLRNFEIQVVLDVRSVPYSQYTHQFNRELFAQTLHAAGIEYRFAGEHLGGRPEEAKYYKHRQKPEGKANYLELVDYDELAKSPGYQRALARLIAIAGEQRTAVMCSEEDPRRCHRHHLIAQTLLKQSVAVAHIRLDGCCEVATLEQHAQQLSLI